MSNILVHHGIKGMHWGVRRYQNYDGSLKNPSARKMKRKLNRLDSDLAVLQGDYNDHLKKKTKYENKNAILENEKEIASTVGKDKKIEKIDNKIKSNNKKIKEIQTYIDNTNEVAKENLKATKRIIDKCSDLNYSVFSAPTARVSKTYYDGYYYYRETVPGTKYRVLKNEK